MVDTIIHKRDSARIKIYKQLCKMELKWCQDRSETICNKANVLYKKYMSGETFAGRDRCLDFPRLEQACKKYNKLI